MSTPEHSTDRSSPLQFHLEDADPVQDTSSGEQEWQVKPTMTIEQYMIMNKNRYQVRNN